MAALPKPASCACGSIEFKHTFKPEQWTCKLCNTVCAERAQRNNPSICRVCKAQRDSKPFSRWSNICLECKRDYNKEYSEANKEQIRVQHKLSYQRDKKKRIMSVRQAVQRSPEAFIRALLHHITAKCNQKKVANGTLNSACLDIQIDFDYLWKLYRQQRGLCALSAIKMTHQFNDLLAMSVDRKDSTKGYIDGNVQLVCQFINTAKRHYSNDDFKRVLYQLKSAQSVRLDAESDGAVKEWLGRGEPVTAFLYGVYLWLVDEYWLHGFQVRLKPLALSLKLRWGSVDLTLGTYGFTLMHDGLCGGRVVFASGYGESDMWKGELADPTVFDSVKRFLRGFLYNGGLLAGVDPDDVQMWEDGDIL